MLTKLSTFYLQIFFKGVNQVYIDHIRSEILSSQKCESCETDFLIEERL